MFKSEKWLRRFKRDQGLAEDPEQVKQRRVNVLKAVLDQLNKIFFEDSLNITELEGFRGYEARWRVGNHDSYIRLMLGPVDTDIVMISIDTLMGGQRSFTLDTEGKEPQAEIGVGWTRSLLTRIACEVA
jgi:hypothetical protein